MSVTYERPTDVQPTDEKYDGKTIRERIAENPRPAKLWFAGFSFLILIELGRFAGGLIAFAEAGRFVLGGLASIPGWVAGNTSVYFGVIGGSLIGLLVALLFLSLVVSAAMAVYYPISLVERLGIQRQTHIDEYLERAILTSILAVFAALMVFTPLGIVVDAIFTMIRNGVEVVSSLPTLTSREIISNEGHRTPDGGWEGTFLGLSPAVAWGLRVFVIYAYSFAFLAWIWKGYTVFREHYREADWTPRDDTVNRFRNHYWGIFGLSMVFIFVVMAIFAPSLGPVHADHNIYQPYEHEFQYLDEDGEVQTLLHGSANLQTRSASADRAVGLWSYDQFDRWAPLGTTQDGKDLATFLVYGARTSLVIGLIAIGLGTIIALSLSLITAYYKGVIDLVTIIASDTVISIPAFLLVLLLSVLFQQANHPIADIYDGGFLLALIFAGVYWPGLWRSIRGPSLQVAEEEWVDAAKSYGQRPGMTMRKHMAPYIASYIMIYASLLLGGVIIATAALSFLGLGINPPTPEWGRIVSDGRSYVGTSHGWHISTVSGLMIVFIVTGFNALGDGIRDAIDPESEVGGGTAEGATASGGGG